MFLSIFSTDIRLVQKQDMDLFVNIYSNKQYLKYYSMYFQSSQEERVSVFLRKLQYKKYEVFKANIEKVYTILYNKKPVGFISYYSTTRTNIIGFAFVVAPGYSGKGIGTASVKCLLEQVKKDQKSGYLSKKIEYIEGHIDYRNIASQKTMEKVGFKKVLSNIYCKGMISNIYRKKITTK